MPDKIMTYDRLDEAFSELKYLKKISSQKDLADKLDYNKSHLNEILNRKKPITESLQNALIVKFGFNEYWLTDGKEPKFGLTEQPPIPAHKKGLENLDWSTLKPAEGNTIYTDIPNEAYDLGAHNPDDPKEKIRKKDVIDLGNGFYHMFVPLIQTYAYGSYVMEYNDEKWMEELPTIGFTVDRVPGGTYRAFKVRGSSMDDNSKDAIAEGDFILGRVINQEYYRDQKLHLHRYKDYIIVHREGVWVKRIVDHDVQNGVLHIHSLNPDKSVPEYRDKKVSLVDVLQILNIVQTMRIK